MAGELLRCMAGGVATVGSSSGVAEVLPCGGVGSSSGATVCRSSEVVSGDDLRGCELRRASWCASWRAVLPVSAALQMLPCGEWLRCMGARLTASAVFRCYRVAVVRR